MKNKPQESEEFEALLDEIFMLPDAGWLRIKDVFKGEVSIHALKTEASGNSLEVITKVAELSQEDWKRMNKVFVPSSTDGFNKAFNAVRSGAITTLKWHLEGKMFHQEIGANATDKYGTSLMHWAAKSRDVIKVLLEYGAAADPRDTCGTTPLMIAADFDECHSTNEMQLLVDNGARLNSRASYGNTPLHALCERLNRNISSLRYLLKSGADPTLVDSSGKKPADLIEDQIKETLGRAAEDSRSINIAGIEIGGMDKHDRQYYQKRIDRYRKAIRMLNAAEKRMKASESKPERASDSNPNDKTAPQSEPQLSTAENKQLISRLETLKTAFRQGLLTDEEYEAKKAKLLEEL